MAINPIQPGPILFTRQRHEAKKMGLHWDYRMVVGDKAYSWATKKEMPEPGKAIVLFEQPVHDSAYALSERVEIPDGNYGAGVTTLDFVRKARIESSEDGTMVLHSGDERFLLKKLDDSKYGKSAWLFKNLTTTNMKKEAGSLLKFIKSKGMKRPNTSNHFLHQDVVDTGADYLTLPIADRRKSFVQVKGHSESKRLSSASYSFGAKHTPAEVEAVKADTKRYVKQVINPNRTEVINRQNAFQNRVKQAGLSNKYLEKVAAKLKLKHGHGHGHGHKIKEVVRDELIERGVDAVKEEFHKHRHKHEKK